MMHAATVTWQRLIDQGLVGTLLQEEDDPALVAADKRIHDCALAAMQAQR